MTDEGAEGIGQVAEGPGEATEGPGEAAAGTGQADANEQFAQRLARDVEGVLGVGIALQHVSLEGELPVQIHATCLADGQTRELVGEGPTILEASRDLIRRAAELRLATAWWRLVGPA